MSDNLEHAQKTFNRADKLLRIGAGIFLAFVLIVVTVTSVEVFTVQQTIAKNQAINSKASNDRFVRYENENARQQRITQQYVQCVASTLTTPIADRTTNQFDNCSKTAQAQNLVGKPSTSPSP